MSRMSFHAHNHWDLQQPRRCPPLASPFPFPPYAFFRFPPLRSYWAAFRNNSLTMMSFWICVVPAPNSIPFISLYILSTGNSLMKP